MTTSVALLSKSTSTITPSYILILSNVREPTFVWNSGTQTLPMPPNTVEFLLSISQYSMNPTKHHGASQANTTSPYL